MSYRDFHRRSLEDRERFWTEEAKLVDWHKPFGKVLDYSKPPFAKWFVGGETNLCHNAVDRHLASNGIERRTVIPLFTTMQAQVGSGHAQRRRVVFAGRVIDAAARGGSPPRSTSICKRRDASDTT